MKLRSQALQGTKSAARAVGIPGIHAGEDVKTPAFNRNGAIRWKAGTYIDGPCSF